MKNNYLFCLWVEDKSQSNKEVNIKTFLYMRTTVLWLCETLSSFEKYCTETNKVKMYVKLQKKPNNPKTIKQYAVVSWSWDK